MPHNTPFIPGQVDCIVRMHDPARLTELQRCLFSLYGQWHRPLRVLIVVQRFAAQSLRAVDDLLAPLRALADPPRFEVLNYEAAQPADARSALLNLGIAHCEGQYLAFLDYDDTLYPEAYRLLSGRLHETGAAIAFASVRVMNVDVHPAGGFVQPTGRRQTVFAGCGLGDLWQGNFCPLHSYLMDRSRIAPGVLRYDTGLSFEEDYDLLLRLCAGHPSDFSLLGTEIGDYNFKSDGSNSTLVGAPSGGHEDARMLWARARTQARRLLSIPDPKDPGPTG